jgi:hypothetical protein
MTTSGEREYGFWKALRYSAAPAELNCSYVRIEFLTEVQISRVEIDHDRAK